MSAARSMPGRPAPHQVIFAVGWVTLLEWLRDKILYNTFLLALLVLAAGALGARMTSMHPDRIAVDFGMAALSLSTTALAILLGAGVLNREFDRRTAYVALSKPISRTEFVIGKYAGICGLLSMNAVLLGGILIALLAMLWDSFNNGIAGGFALLASAITLVLIEGFVLAAITIFFSTFSTPSLSVTLCFCLTMIGHNVSELRALVIRMDGGFLKTLANGVCAILPNLERFSLGTQLTYGLPLEVDVFLIRAAYGASLVLLFLVLSGLLIRTREV